MAAKATSIAKTYLDALADELEISDTRYEQAEESYQSLGRWFNRPASSLKPYGPAVYVQGSFGLGTVIKPLHAEEEYDVDAVCELKALNKSQLSQERLKAIVGAEMEDYRRSQAMTKKMREGRRCWTLNYADGAQFHMDVVPALPNGHDVRILIESRGLDSSRAGTAIGITDNERFGYHDITNDWPRSNPKGYLDWFKGRMRVEFEKRRRILAEAVKASVEAIPEYKVRTPLQSSIMILKRHRDIMYVKDELNCCPISIIITTLAAHAYDGEEEIADALLSILSGMESHISRDSTGRAVIANPSDPLENFADKWAEFPEREHAFFEWLRQAQRDFAYAASLANRNAISESLSPHLGQELAETCRRPQCYRIFELATCRIRSRCRCAVDAFVWQYCAYTDKAARLCVIWWTDLPTRARAERQAVADLAETEDWLQAVKWRLNNDLQFVADFDIAHLTETYPLSLTFPHFFPAVPPQVTPRDGTRISGHQYGAGGELCLEYRPDNWEPSFTGAMMIESAYRLLSGETPNDGEAVDVASAHRQTAAQELRNTKLRLILDAVLLETLIAQPTCQPQPFTLDEHWFAKHWLAHPRRLGASDGPPIWSAPPPLIDPRTRDGFAIRLPDELDVPFEASYAFLNTLLTALQYTPALGRMAASDAEMPVLIVHRGAARLYSVAHGKGDRDVYAYRTIIAPSNEQRLSAEHAGLADRTVAIVGCGSVGSKVAAALTRAGVGTLVLVDGDLLLPGNLVRNELDWREVGLNKPDALAARLRDINPSVNTIARKLLLGGQESSASTELGPSTHWLLRSDHRCDRRSADFQSLRRCGLRREKADDLG